MDRYAFSGVCYTAAKEVPGLGLDWCKARYPLGFSRCPARSRLRLLLVFVLLVCADWRTHSHCGREPAEPGGFHYVPVRFFSQSPDTGLPAPDAVIFLDLSGLSP